MTQPGIGGGAVGVASGNSARASLALVALMFVAPFLLPYHRFPLTSYYSEWLALALGVGALLAYAAHRRRDGVLLPWFISVPLALAALIGVQTAAGQVPYAGQGIAAIAYLVWAGALIVLSASLVRDLGAQSVIRVLAWSLVVGGLLSALAGLIQQYFGSWSIVGTWVARKLGPGLYGNLAQRNQFADYTSLALASLAYLRATGCLRGWLAALLAAPLLLALGLSGARIAWLFILVPLGLTAFVWRAQRDKPEARRLVACLGLMLLGFIVAQQVVALAPLAPSSGVVTTPTERLFAEMAGPSERGQLWTEAGWAFLRAPVLGWGWGGFPAMHFDYQATHDALAGHDAYHQAHNLILQLLAETGAVGAALVIAGFGYWLWDLRRGAFGLERWWQLALLGVLAVHSMSEYPLWYSYFLGMVAVLLGIAGGDRGWVVPARSVRLPLAALCAVGGVYLVFQVGAYRDFERVFTSKEFDIGGGAEQGRLVARALSDPVLRPYGELAIAFSTPVGPSRVQEKLALVSRAVRFAPYYPVVHKRVLLMAMAGEGDVAARELARAIRAYPNESPSVLQQLGELAAHDPGRFKTLLETAHKARGQVPLLNAAPAVPQ
jgi:O-antigen ligase